MLFCAEESKSHRRICNITRTVNDAETKLSNYIDKVNLSSSKRLQKRDILLELLSVPGNDSTKYDESINCASVLDNYIPYDQSLSVVKLDKLSGEQDNMKQIGHINPHRPESVDASKLIPIRSAAIEGNFVLAVALFDKFFPRPRKVKKVIEKSMPSPMHHSLLKKAFKLLMMAFKNSPELNFDNAYIVLDMMEVFHVRPTVEVYNVMMNACISSCNWRLALSILRDLKQSKYAVVPNTHTFTTIIDCCRHAADAPDTIYDTLKKEGFEESFCYKAALENANSRLNKQVVKDLALSVCNPVANPRLASKKHISKGSLTRLDVIRESITRSSSSSRRLKNEVSYRMQSAEGLSPNRVLLMSLGYLPYLECKVPAVSLEDTSGDTRSSAGNKEVEERQQQQRDDEKEPIPPFEILICQETFLDSEAAREGSSAASVPTSRASTSTGEMTASGEELRIIDSDVGENNPLAEKELADKDEVEVDEVGGTSRKLILPIVSSVKSPSRTTLTSILRNNISDKRKSTYNAASRSMSPVNRVRLKSAYAPVRGVTAPLHDPERMVLRGLYRA